MSENQPTINKPVIVVEKPEDECEVDLEKAVTSSNEDLTIDTEHTGKRLSVFSEDRRSIYSRMSSALSIGSTIHKLKNVYLISIFLIGVLIFTLLVIIITRFFL